MRRCARWNAGSRLRFPLLGALLAGAFWAPTLAGGQVDTTSPDPTRLGLEDYFQYESVETGGQSRLHVNLATGNVVWHAVPVVNAGRGLATVVNLTYNSHPRVGEITLPQREPGAGFSLGVSGVTRLSEPLRREGSLSSAPPTVVLDDPDGTRHRFVRRSDGVTYEAPKGVQLHLRRFSRSLGPDPQGGVGSVAEPKKAWAMTRPDGVTHFFDLSGYQTSVADRNGNKIEFVYDYIVPASGSSCEAGQVGRGLEQVGVPDPASCSPRVREVRDATNRALHVRYWGFESVADAGWSPGRIKEVEDHAGRVTSFRYQGDYLQELERAARLPASSSFEPAPATFGFDYEAGLPANLVELGISRKLTAVTDPRGMATADSGGDGRTRIDYEALNLLAAPSTIARRRPETITNREGNARTFDFESLGGGASRAKVTDADNRETTHDLDSRGRLVKKTDALHTETRLEWDDATTNDNNVAKLTEAAGTDDFAATTMTYDDNGLLKTSNDPEDGVTELTYRSGSGTYLSDFLDPATGKSIDEKYAFVADLTSTTTPKGTATTADPNDFKTRFVPDAKGNVTARILPGEHQAKTTFDDFGQIKEEEDEVGNKTQYSAYDPSGLPRIVTDAKGTLTETDQTDGRWIYRYDESGNVTAVSDPRGTKTGDHNTLRTAFTTKLTYDALDRLTRETRPKLSADGQFLTREWSYDRNGNEIVYKDGTNATTTKTYTGMDQVATTESPPTQHYGESGAASEITQYSYTDTEKLETVVRPEGMRTPTTPTDYSTGYVYDAIDRVVAETRRSRGGDLPDQDLSVSYAYDRRDNLVGLVDPRRNASNANSPQANAQNPALRRFTYEYDKSDNRTAAIEDPGDKALRTEYAYDANDNLRTLIDPRGFEPNKSRSDYTTRFEYDQRNLLTDRIDPKGNRTSWSYRGDGRLAAETKPKGMASADPDDFKTIFEYDPTGELKRRRLPIATFAANVLDAYGRRQRTLEYERNEVGDPVKITDPRGHAFTNTFYDTGHLRSTNRPSWWNYRGEGEADDSSARPQREGEPPSPASQLPSNLRAPQGQPAEITERPLDQMGERGGAPELPNSEGEGDFGEVKPEQVPGMLPKAGPTSFAYDAEMRLTEVDDAASATTFLTRDPLGRVTQVRRPFDAGNVQEIVQRSAFDRHGNLRESIDGENHSMIRTYDQFDRLVREAAPGSNLNDERDVTEFGYDPNGNLTRRQTPRGADYTHRMTYDLLDRLETQTDPESNKTTYGYDGAGNRSSVRSPRGNRPGLSGDERNKFTTTMEFNGADELEHQVDGLGQRTEFDYDPNSNQIKVTAPGAKRTSTQSNPDPRITERTFDGRDLPWTESTGDGADKRTTITEFDGNGNLRRVVKPNGVDQTGKFPLHSDSGEGTTAGTNAPFQATVFVRSDDNLVTSTVLPWGGNTDRRWQQDFRLDDRGRVRSINAPYDTTDNCDTTPANQGNDPGCTSRTSYTYFETGWIKSVSEPKVVAPSASDPIYDHLVDYRYDRRGHQTRWASTKGSTLQREVTRTYFPSGTQRQKAALDPNEPDPSRRTRTYTYTYNRNRSMASMVDQLENRTTLFEYDKAERQIRINETGTKTQDTGLRYDENGNITTRQTDGGFNTQGGYDGGKTTSFSFDELDREKEMETVVATNDEPRRTTSTEYYPSGEISKRTWRGGGPDVVEESFYLTDGRLARVTNSALQKNQAYAYDGNGNRSQDERGSHIYNARDHLIKWQVKGSQEHTDYEVNGSGAVTKRTVSDAQLTLLNTTTTYTYDGQRLLKETEQEPGPLGARHVRTYGYDELGSVTSIDKSTNGGAATAVARYTYDGFERLKSAKDSDNPLHQYTYDGLDRRDTRQQPAPGGTGPAEIVDYSYIGPSEALSKEQKRGEGTTYTYDYDSAFEPQGQSTRPQPGQPSHRPYVKDANGSVEALLQPGGGAVEGKYNYDPYGRTKPEEEQAHNPATAANPFRFEGFYYDSGVRLYDMRARTYRPDVGRFLTQDRFEAAQGDFNLQSDPLTQNRYAFAGGNPVNDIEWDGHRPLRRSGATSAGSGTDDPHSDDDDYANRYEKAWCRRHPRTCIEFRKAARKAERLTEHLFSQPRDGSDGSKANAFQHAFWVALMVRRVKDDDRARTFAFLHENWDFESNDRELQRISRMDLHNNYVGFRLGRKYQHTHNDEFLCSKILSLIRRRGRFGKTRDRGRPYWIYRNHIRTNRPIRFNRGANCADA